MSSDDELIERMVTAWSLTQRKPGETQRVYNNNVMRAALAAVRAHDSRNALDLLRTMVGLAIKWHCEASGVKWGLTLKASPLRVSTIWWPTFARR